MLGKTAAGTSSLAPVRMIYCFMLFVLKTVIHMHLNPLNYLFYFIGLINNPLSVILFLNWKDEHEYIVMNSKGRHE
jgi:hypothetical protein